MRKTKSVTITAEGRDKGKVFVIREMDAWQAEEWAQRAVEAIAQKTAIPDGIANAGMLGIYIFGAKALLSAPYAMIKPLMDEMFATCLSIQPDPTNPSILRGAGTPDVRAVGPMIPDDTEEVATRLFLRDAIIELHSGFSVAAALSQQWEKLMAVAALISPNTLTSQEPSAQS